MLFPTLSFAAFFALVLPVSWLLMPHRVQWRLFMIAASWFFYGAADWRFVPLLAGSTVVNHYFARRIDRARGNKRRAWTITAVSTNLVVLAWFKYIGFLSLSAQSSLRYLGIHAHVPLPEVLLPIGISFFTFQALSYVIDTSRGKIHPVSLIEFAVYLSFFPHLVAGPIVRATEFLPQIKEKISPRHIDVGKAFWLISLGLFKKVVIASYLGTYAADPLFGFPRQHAGVEALFGVYAYAIQIYADFSGYTDIAIGLALLLGIRFPQNFNAPYAAASLQDFWRRWHMTLSRWLRDYLYIPLGGSRRGKVRTYLNIMITMLLGGLWHGAAWTFVAWGALHGTGLIVERLRGERRVATEDGGKGPAVVALSAGVAGGAPTSGQVPVAGSPPPLSPAPATEESPGQRVLGARRDEVLVTHRVGIPNGKDSEPPPPAEDAPGQEAPAATPGPELSETELSGGELWDAIVASRARPAGSRSLSAAMAAGQPDPEPTGAVATTTTTETEPAEPVAGAADAGGGAGPAPDGPQVGEPPSTSGAGPVRRGRRPLSPTARLWMGRLITFHVVCLAWIFFRASSFHNAIEVLGRIAVVTGHHRPFNWKVAAVICGALGAQLGPRGVGPRLQVLFSRTPFWVQALLLAGALTVIDLLGPAGIAPFIYFRF